MKKKKFFKCEICGEETPIECEGANPNTCAMCCPIHKEELIQQKHVLEDGRVVEIDLPMYTRFIVGDKKEWK